MAATTAIENWVLPNKKGFLKWAYTKFHVDADDSRLRPHQQLVRDYLNIYTPYRGLLLYHGLGTGKTAASIAVAESFLKVQRIDDDLHKNRHIIVLVSASLEANYRKEVRIHATVNNPFYARWVKIIIPMKPLYDFNEILDNIYRRFYIHPDFARKQIDKNTGEFWLPGPLDPKFLEENPAIKLDITDAPEDAVPKDLTQNPNADTLALNLFGDKWENLDDRHKLHIESIIDIITGTPWKELEGNDSKIVEHIIDNIIKERFTFLHYNAGNIVDKINRLNINLNFDRTKSRWMRYRFPAEEKNLPSDFNYNLKSDYGFENHKMIRALNKKYNLDMSRYVYLLVPELFMGVKHWSRYEDGMFEWNNISNHYFAMDCFNKMIEEKPDLIQKIDTRRTIFDNSCIIMDEAHNFMSSITRESKTRVPIYNWMLYARNAKIVLLSGTPLINYPFELSMMINMLRGPMMHYIFKLGEETPVPSGEEIANALKAQNLLPMIDYVASKPNEGEIHYSVLPYGFIRSDPRDLDIGFYIKRGSWNINSQKLHQEIERTLKREFDTSGVLTTETLFALPPIQQDFNDLFLDQSDYTHPKVINGDFFQRRIIGTVSFMRTTGMAKIVLNDPIRVEMSYPQHKNYVEVRIQEIRMEENRYRKGQQQQASPLASQNTVYRAFSRMACNFTFMQETDREKAHLNIQRKYPFNIRKELREEIASASIEESEPVAAIIEGGANSLSKEVSKKYQKQLEELMKEVKARSKDMLTRDKLRHYTSPKFAAILDKINEGLDEVDKQSTHRSGQWKTLLYSDFRTVEGIGIMKLVLEEAGYVNVNLIKTAQGWTIENHEEVLSEKYNFKRFIEFTDDKEQAQMAINFYNDNHRYLPAEIQQLLKNAGLYADYKMETPYQDKEFWLRGGPCRIMMITKLAAEGISLKNVRRVLITEPFWNNARINQVIGRAVRMDSHMHFKEEFENRGWEVDVDVFMFITVFKPELLQNSESSLITIKRIDNSMTTDESIYELAKKKSEIIETFFKYLQMTAIDCMSNASMNKNDIPCYSFPVNSKANQLAYEPDIRKDKEHLQLENKQIDEKLISHAKATQEYTYIYFIPAKPLRENAPVLKNIGLTAKYYDSEAWTYTGKLIPAVLPNEKITYEEPAPNTEMLKTAIAENKVILKTITRKYVKVKDYKEYFDYDAYIYAKVLTPAILNKVLRKWSIKTGHE